MKALDIVREQRAKIEEQRSAAIEEMEAVASVAIEETRNLSDDEAGKVDAAQAQVAELDSELEALDAREAELVAIEERTEAIAKRPELQVISRPDSTDVMQDRSATPQQLADALTRSLDGRVDSAESMDHVRKLAIRHRGDREWARGLIARASDEYESGWGKVVTGAEMSLTPEERTALSTVTNANGNYLVPTHLDPTVIITNDGSSNVIRSLSRVVTLTRPGDTSWQGITSAGITASFDAQLTEVSDDSPTFGQPSIATHKAQAFAQASIEASEDIPGLAGELLMMFSDARDRLEGAAHATGTGTNEPWGVFSATYTEVVSDTAAGIFKEDLDEVYRTLPIRHRGAGVWCMNPLWAIAVQNLGTAVSNKFTTTMDAGTTSLLYGKPVVESDDAPADVTTTVKDPEILFGDFSNYVIVDKPGSFAVEFIPHLFNTSGNLPDGRRGWYCTWRTGADSVNSNAFVVLADKTSA